MSLLLLASYFFSYGFREMIEVISPPKSVVSNNLPCHHSIVDDRMFWICVLIPSPFAWHMMYVFVDFIYNPNQAVHGILEDPVVHARGCGGQGFGFKYGNPALYVLRLFAKIWNMVGGDVERTVVPNTFRLLML